MVKAILMKSHMEMKNMLLANGGNTIFHKVVENLNDSGVCTCVL
jgi:hypothetical protein